ncbi:hypothetical protein EDD18DRAFT_1354223 [Armillaria luteobubalina]|uniref:Uncharacterized protein n=1 Tax=Armillaria luteobubalina TaxID=153913 RepID=A0AA39USN4_9AGAR|nr:hypothetical protein EDD18DRAFT_1354223 [Armillaria luteobubalina]
MAYADAHVDSKFEEITGLRDLDVRHQFAYLARIVPLNPAQCNALRASADSTSALRRTGYMFLIHCGVRLIVPQMDCGMMLDLNTLRIGIDWRTTRYGWPISGFGAPQARLLFQPHAKVREPLTTTLGLAICAPSTHWAEGTGGFFIIEGGDTKRLLLIASPSLWTGTRPHFERKNTSELRHDVTLFDASTFFNKYLRFIQTIKGKDDEEVKEELQNAQGELVEASKALEKLHTFYQEVSTHRATQGAAF